jgi:hypothetical protein
LYDLNQLAFKTNIFKKFEDLYLKFEKLSAHGCRVLQEPTALTGKKSEKALKSQLPKLLFDPCTSKGKSIYLHFFHGLGWLPITIASICMFDSFHNSLQNCAG